MILNKPQVPTNESTREYSDGAIRHTTSVSKISHRNCLIDVSVNQGVVFRDPTNLAVRKMTRILTDVFSIVCLREAERVSALSIDLMDSGVFNLLQNIVLCDEILVDSSGPRLWNLDLFCNRFEGVFTFIEEDSSTINSEKNLLNLSVGDTSDGFLERTQYYLDCARKHNVYLTLHPERERHLRSIIKEDRPQHAAQIAVDYLDREIGNTTAAEYSGIDFAVPPVAEYVVSFCKKNKVDLITGISEIRGNKHALIFRKWCSELDEALVDGRKGRSSVANAQKLLKEMDKVSTGWATDIERYVKYVPRELSLRKIWGIGSLLEATGFSKIQVNDPVLTPKTPHLLFLNDLYREIN